MVVIVVVIDLCGGCCDYMFETIENSGRISRFSPLRSLCVVPRKVVGATIPYFIFVHCFGRASVALVGQNRKEISLGLKIKLGVIHQTRRLNEINQEGAF